MHFKLLLTYNIIYDLFCGLLREKGRVGVRERGREGDRERGRERERERMREG